MSALIKSVYLIALLVMAININPLFAEECMLDTNGDGTADGTGGASSSSSQVRIVCGVNATAGGGNSTALGNGSSSGGSDSSAIGASASADGDDAVAHGVSSRAQSTGSISLGRAAGFNNNNSNANSPNAIAIGHYANITAASPGAIAIGGDTNDTDLVGAQASGTKAIAIGEEAKATAAGAIALGADVVANKANTMTVGVPMEVKRSDGKTQIMVNEKIGGNSVRTLFNVVCDTCTGRLKPVLRSLIILKY